MSNRPIITGIDRMESNVVTTYSALEWAASRSYSWAMEVVVVQAGVMAASYTVMRMFLPSATKVCAWQAHSSSRMTNGQASSRRNATR